MDVWRRTCICGGMDDHARVDSEPDPRFFLQYSSPGRNATNLRLTWRGAVQDDDGEVCSAMDDLPAESPRPRPRRPWWRFW